MQLLWIQTLHAHSLVILASSFLKKFLSLSFFSMSVITACLGDEDISLLSYASLNELTTNPPMSGQNVL